MKYSLIRNSSDPKVIGVKNGIYQIEIDKSSFKTEKDYKDFCSSFSKDNFKVNFAPGIKEKPTKIKLLPKAIITDFMGFCPYLENIAFAITESSLSFLKNYSLKDYEVIELEFTTFEIKRCYLFWYPATEFEAINFKSSIIFTGNELLGKTYHAINNLGDFKEFMKKNPLFSFEKIVLDKTELVYDLIWLRAGGMFISEKLKDGIIKEGLTGLNIVEKHAPILEFSS